MANQVPIIFVITIALLVLVIVGTAIYLYTRRQIKIAEKPHLPPTLDPQRVELVRQIKGLPESHFALVDGFHIRYVQVGETSKPDLLLIHGIGESLYHWRLILQSLAAHYRVTAIDLPGFGFSDKHTDQNYGLDEQTERVFHLLDQLKIDKCYVAGHSMGGAIASWMAKKQPERIIKLALLAPAATHKIIWINPDHFWWGVHLTKHFVVTKKLVRTIFKLCVYEVPSSFENDLEEYYRPFANNPASVITFVKANHLLRDKRIPAEMADLHPPILLLYGDHDRIVKEKHLTEFTKLNPRLHFYRVSDCGHQIAEEKPALTVEKLKEFFQ
jgi:pimeloyl-ACP methyl ester carboxylesterase